MNIPSIEPFTNEELTIISFGLGKLAENNIFKAVDYNLLMKKINNMVKCVVVL